MNKPIPQLTIVTPAYNRGNLLRACFRSLAVQTNKNFEWIVVDDGSTDNTQAVLAEIQLQNGGFPIVCVHKENGGKHTALNASHPYIRGQYVLILDSDDTLTPDAVEEVLAGWRQFADDFRVGVIRFARQTADGRLCSYGKEEYLPTDMLREQRVFAVSGDSCEVLRTELFKKYPFPVFAGERFLAETALWYRVARDAECVYINKGIYICEYLEGGLTKSGKKLQISNPQGGMYNSNLRMDRRCSLKERVKAGLLYCCYGFYAGCSVKKMIRTTDRKCFVMACMLPGFGLYHYWKRRY